jgi:hypothetical protein
MYEIIYNQFSGRIDCIRRLYDNACIPLCEDNTDYQEFLIWNKAQAIPLDLNSTIEVVKSVPARDLGKEIDELKAQAKINSENIATIASVSDISVKPLPIKEELIKEG